MMTTRLPIAILALTTLAAPGAAEFVETPRDVPLERLEANVQAWLRDHPDEAQGYYVLGRLRSIAYARESDRFDDVYPGGDGNLPGLSQAHFEGFLPEPREAWRDQTRRQLERMSRPEPAPGADRRIDELVRRLDADAYAERAEARRELVALGPEVLPALRAAIRREGLSAEQRGGLEAAVRSIEAAASGAMHLSGAIDAYRTALEKDPAHHASRLGLAWSLEEAGRTEEAIEAYRRAHFEGAKVELGPEEFSFMEGGWHESIAYEAGRSLLALLPADHEDRPAIEDNLEKLEAKIEQASRWITPIVVPLGGVQELAELVDPDRAVEFDLDGDGVAERVRWLRPAAGLLVWDPRGTGVVENGRTLFGSATWGVHWRHGYEPLALLDDDRDGWIAGPETEGLAIWRDDDADGASDPGEVRPLAAWGIEALACRPVPTAEAPWCPRGARMADGTTRPTFDWIPRPLVD